MKNQDKYRNVPHGELIVENGNITIPSIFMFTTSTEMQSFLHSCKMLNCTVYFENESMKVAPGEHDGHLSARLGTYGFVINFPKAAEDYIKYLCHKDDMIWGDK